MGDDARRPGLLKAKVVFGLKFVNLLEEFLVFHRAIMADVAGRSSDAVAFITQAHDADPYTADIVEAYARILGNAGQLPL